MRKYIHGRVYDTNNAIRVCSFYYSYDPVCGYDVYYKRTGELFILFLTPFSSDIYSYDSFYSDALKLRFKRMVFDALNDGLAY